jgi:hypothetical protein
MERVMWDMAQADQYAALYLAKDSAHIDRKAETMRLYAEVFRLHQVTPEEFRESYQYYLAHPVLNQLLFDSVIARGVRARSEMYDRPSQYHPPVPPVPPVGPGAVVPGGRGTMPGARGTMPGTRGTMPGQNVVTPSGGGVSALMQRVREAAARRQDSIRRAMHVKRDTTRGRP